MKNRRTPSTTRRGLQFASLLSVCFVPGFQVALADQNTGTVGDDPFDSTQGTTVTRHNTLIDPINAFRQSGGDLGIAIEGGHAFMGLGTSFIEFETASDVSIDGVRLFAFSDGAATNFRRSFNNFTLLADTDDDGVYETTVTDTAINSNYDMQTGNVSTDTADLNGFDITYLDLTLMAASTVTSQKWRLETVSSSPSSGSEPRLVELDAIPAANPAPVIDTYASGLNGPRGLLFDSAGNLYVSVAVSGGFQVLQIAPDGTQTGLASPLLPNRVADLAFDNAGNLYVTLQSRAVRINNDGSTTDVATGITNVSGISFDANNDMYISTATLSGQSIYRVSSSDISAIDNPGYDPAAVAIDVFATAGVTPIPGALRDLFFDSTSGLLLVSSQQAGIWSLDPVTSATVQLSAGSSLGVTSDAEGNVFYAGFASQAVFKIDASEVTNPARDISNVTVIAGTVGVASSTGDGGPATSATLALPEWIAVSGADVYVAERGPGSAPSTTRIRVIEGAAVAPPPNLDADEDGVPDATDNCSAVFNTDQADLDDDGIGDVCDPDLDGDGVDNSVDTFPNDPTETADADMDGVGDNSDAFPNDATETADADMDGVGDNSDAFPNDPAESADIDMDGVGDNGDNCPIVPNGDQTDINGDGFGDACVDPNANIDPSAFGSNPIIDAGANVRPGAQFGDNADIGADATIRRDVSAGDNVTVAANATVRRDATLGNDVEIGVDAVVGTGAIIGNNVTVEANAVVKRDAVVGDRVTVSEGAVIAAEASIGDDVNIGEGAKIRRGATVGNNVQIGPNVIIRPGVVIEDNVQIGVDCPIATSENDPPCVVVRQGSVLAGQNVIGTDVILRQDVTVPVGFCVANGTTVARNTTVDTLCQ